MHKLYMHHGVALLGGRANRSAKLRWFFFFFCFYFLPLLHLVQITMLEKKAPFILEVQLTCYKIPLAEIHHTVTVSVQTDMGILVNNYDF